MLLSRAEGLEQEEIQMRELCAQLAGLEKSGGPGVLSEAQRIIARLRSMNNRWNIPELSEFLKKRQRELFYDF